MTTEKELANLHKGSSNLLGLEINKVFQKCGFKIIESKTAPLAYQSVTWLYDGRENMLLIAEKPRD